MLCCIFKLFNKLMLIINHHFRRGMCVAVSLSMYIGKKMKKNKRKLQTGMKERKELTSHVI